MNRRTKVFLLALCCCLSAAPTGGAQAETTDGDLPAAAYHLRIVRVGSPGMEPGAAIGWGRDAGTPVVLPADEVWGTPEQLAALEQLLGVEGAKAVTGFFVQPENGSEALFERDVYVGGSVVALSFRAVPPQVTGRAHRISLRVADVAVAEPPLAEATLLMATDRTVAIAMPGLPQGEWLVLAVTALAPADATERIGRSSSVLLPDGEEVSMPELVTKASPRYPEAARKAGLSGEVILQLIIDEQGIPRAPVVLRMTPGCEELAGAAVEAVRQWRYEPARMDGRPVAVAFTVVVRFALE